MQPFLVRLPPELLEWLRARAEAEHTTMAGILRALVLDAARRDLRRVG